MVKEKVFFSVFYMKPDLIIGRDPIIQFNRYRLSGLTIQSNLLRKNSQGRTLFYFPDGQDFIFLQNYQKTLTNLSGINLSYTKLVNSDLSWANLSKANLSNSNLTGTSLNSANLSEADLTQANLQESDLGMVDLTKATLEGTNFTNADLASANLNRCNYLWHRYKKFEMVSLGR